MQFFPPAPQEGEEAAGEEEAEQETKQTLDQELSELRIRQLSTLRRTAYRTRSYFIIGTLGCLWVTIPLIISIVQPLRAHRGWGMWQSAYALLAVAALIGAGKFAVRVVEIQRGINADLRARELEELEAAKREPDLSLLSDGSQHARNLERMFAADDAPPADDAVPPSS